MAELVLGVDEAGRGPVVGPMIVAGVVVPRSRLSLLQKAGVRDSKKLTPGMRSRLLELIKAIANLIVVVEVPPSVIDEYNLNLVERDTIALVVWRAVTLVGGVNHVYVDVVGSPEELVKTIRRTGYSGVIVAEPKADEHYTVVSAASIVAKVYRDRVIEELRRMYGVEGSGYPTDPKTIAWIRRVYMERPENPPPFIRRSWATLKTIAPKWYKPKRSDTRSRSLLEFL